MRTAIFVGFFMIAAAIRNIDMFSLTGITDGISSVDGISISILTGIFLAFDVFEFIVKVKKYKDYINKK